jgi:hypothetical protein
MSRRGICISTSVCDSVRDWEWGESMASLMGGFLGQFKTKNARGLFWQPKGKIRQVILRGASKRAYTFEVFAPNAARSLWETGAVYGYARAVADKGGCGYAISYVGRTANMAQQDSEHARLQHFAGYDIDTLLVLRIEQEAIRADVEGDLRALYQPLLNDLLRSGTDAS